MNNIWDRKEVAYCTCAARQAPHAHCPCEDCKGNAVSRSTELRHWKNSLQVAASCDRARNIGERADIEEPDYNTALQIADLPAGQTEDAIAIDDETLTIEPDYIVDCADDYVTPPYSDVNVISTADELFANTDEQMQLANTDEQCS
ncbi:hypothetical protein EMCRGX_G006106 [Ephydatia muelleri]